MWTTIHQDMAAVCNERSREHNTIMVIQRTFMKRTDKYKLPKTNEVRQRNLSELQSLHDTNPDFYNTKKVTKLLRNVKPENVDYWRRVNNHILALRIFVRAKTKKPLAQNAEEA